MTAKTRALPSSAYELLASGAYSASFLTRGPWHPDHQHAGPPIALVCRAIEHLAARHGLTHIARLTTNLLRPVPITEISIDVATDYVGRNAGHFSAQLIANGKEVARFTALAQRESDLPLPQDLPGHPLPMMIKGPEESPIDVFPFAGEHVGYADLVETRVASGQLFKGPCAIWFKLCHPLLGNESPSPYQLVAVAADSGNGVSAILDLSAYSFVNSDLTINLLRKPQGEWICIDARTHLGPNGGGLAESRLYDVQGLIGRATQSLTVSRRARS